MGTAWWLQLSFKAKDGRKDQIGINPRIKMYNTEFDIAFLYSNLQWFGLEKIKVHVILPRKPFGDC
jgi:hypothetical protein